MGKVATASLAALVGERVCVLANDGRTLVVRETRERSRRVAMAKV